MTMTDLDLVRRREALHAAGVPADDIPDDLLDVADGGPVLGRLPRWTAGRMREWCEVLVRHPGIAREVAAWCDTHAERLANLSLVAVRVEDGWPAGLSPSVYAELSRDDEDARKSAGCVISPTEVERARSPAVVLRLGEALAELERMPRPWWATLEEAVRRARAGEVRPDRHSLTFPGGQPSTVTAHSIHVPSRPRVHPTRLLLELIRRVNAHPFCGAGPGELLMEGDRVERMPGDGLHATYRFAWRDVPWNFWDRHLGAPPYEPGDFFTLP